jgi:hypothetical protein
MPERDKKRGQTKVAGNRSGRGKSTKKPLTTPVKKVSVSSRIPSKRPLRKRASWSGSEEDEDHERIAERRRRRKDR